jgi:tetratricopeptide (TPR) repeat protein
MREFLPFVIRIEPKENGAYPVTADFQGATWSAAIPSDLPLLQPMEVQQASQWLERGFIDRDYAQDFGARLFQTLFAGDLLTGFRAATERAAPDDGLRLVLTVPDELAGLPWELIYDRDGPNGFLARSASTPLARHVAGAPIPHRPPESGPLRVLVVVASPSDLPPISSAKESEALAAAMGHRGVGSRETLQILGDVVRHPKQLADLRQRLSRRKLFEVEILTNATRQRIQTALIEARQAEREVHVIHFIGHGQANDRAGLIMLETEDGKADPISAADFAELIDEPAINLVVLNACQTAAATTLFDGVAQSAIKRGVPAVIGMQVPIIDQTAVTFSREFYGAWAAGEPIESALAYARRLVTSTRAGAAADWGIPVLYMGPVEGLRLSVQPATERRPWPLSVLRMAVSGAIALLTLLGLVFLDLPQVAKAVQTQTPFIRCTLPYRMRSTFNVAVAQFGHLEPRSSPKTYEQAVQHTRDLRTLLRSELGALLAELGGQQGAVQVESYCIVQGETEEARALAAADLAADTNADLVVYGYHVGPLTGGDMQVRFMPSRTNWTWSDLFGGEWFVATERLNCPDCNLQLTLGNRTKALSRIVVAMTYLFAATPCRDYLDGISACRTNLDRALSVLNEEDIPLEQDRILARWTGEGKEVVHLLRGSVYLEKAIRHSLDPRLRSGNREQLLAAWEPALQNYAEAQAAFQAALDENERSSRARMGLALADYNQGILGPTQSIPRVDRAITAYTELLTPPEAGAPGFDKPEGAYVDIKILYNRGLAHYAKYRLLGDPADAQLAQADLEQVLAQYRTLTGGIDGEQSPHWLCARLNLACPPPLDLPRSVREVIARSAYFLGHLYANGGSVADAVNVYNESIQLSVDPITQALAYFALGELHEQEGQPEQAQEAFERLCDLSSMLSGFEGWRDLATANLVELGDEIAREGCP